MKATPEGHDEANSRMSRMFAKMRDVNEQLVLAAVRAQLDSEASARKLQDVARLADLDALTSLPNRTLMRDRFTQAAAAARRHNSRLAVMFVDLNNFKQINDTLGHTIGDAALHRAAECLTASVRAADTVCRYGGDEFVLLITDVSERAGLARIGEQIGLTLGAPFLINEHVVRLGASIGISIFPDDGSEIDVLIAQADAAMYRARHRGVGTYAFHGDEVAGELVLAPDTVAVLQRPVIRYDEVIAEQQRRNDELREANQELVLTVLRARDTQAIVEDAQRRQTEFMAMLAHELRSPLAPMRNVSALLERVGSNDSILPRLQGIIERQVVHMARLIDDLLDVSRAHTGKLRLEREAVQLGSVIAFAVDACRPAMDLRLQKFSLTLPTLPIVIEGDSVRLVQVVTNLLDNASKYTPDGGDLSLELSTTPTHAVISVTDSGIGIAPARAAWRLRPVLPGPSGRGLQRCRPGYRAECGARVGAGAWRHRRGAKRGHRNRKPVRRQPAAALSGECLIGRFERLRAESASDYRFGSAATRRLSTCRLSE